MTVAPRPIASANSCTWVLCMFSPRCEPRRTRQRAFSMSVRSGEPIASPKVSSKPTSRGPRHWANDGAAEFGEPKALRVCFRNVPPMPWLKRATASGPCSALIFSIFSATWPSASSQVTSVHFSSPRTLARRSGARRRSGSKWAPTPPVPRGQRRPRERGSSGLPSTFQRTPSRTVAIALHFQKQRSQKVGTVRIPFSTGPLEARRPPGSAPRVPTAAAPAPTPVIFRKRRRETWFMGDSAVQRRSRARARGRNASFQASRHPQAGERTEANGWTGARGPASHPAAWGPAERGPASHPAGRGLAGGYGFACSQLSLFSGGSTPRTPRVAAIERKVCDLVVHCNESFAGFAATPGRARACGARGSCG